MIDRQSHPVEWALLMYELEDAREHLERLIDEMNSGEVAEEEQLRIDLGHVYAHLNRAWHRRVATGELSDEAWEAASRFPTDLEPI